MNKLKEVNKEKAKKFVSKLEKNHPLKKFWEVGSTANNLLNESSKNYSYKIFKEDLIQQIYELLNNNTI